MKIEEINALINDNVYENTDQAITGGKLQTVLQGMMGSLMGTSSIPIGSYYNSRDVRDVIADSLHNSIKANLLNSGDYFVSNLATHGNLIYNLARNQSFVSELAGNIYSNSTLVNGLATQWGFWTSIMNFEGPKYLTYNTAFISGLRTALHI